MIDSVKKRLMALLNEHVPEDIAMKGLSKISPEIGSFLQKGVTSGLSIASGLDFLRNQFSGKEIPIEKNPHLRPDERAGIRQRMQSQNEQQTIKNIAKGAGKLGLAAAGGAAANLAGNALIDAFGDQEKGQEQPDQTLDYPELFNFIESEMSKGKQLEEIATKLMKSPKLQKFIKEVEKSTGRTFLDYLRNHFEGPKKGAQELMQRMQQQAPGGQQQGNEALLAAIDKIMKM